MDYSEVQRYSSPSGGSHRILWFVLFGVIAVIIFVGVYFLLASKAVSETKLVEGTSLELGANNSVKLKTGDGEEHNLEVNFVGLDSVDITIRSDPIEIKGLKVNEIGKVDLNDDGVADLWIKLVSIKDGKAVIAVKKIEENVCEEDWECESWSSCVLGSQGRDCIDKNSCGTVESRPELTRSCEETSENISVENQSETGELINQTNFSSLEDYISYVKSIDCSAYVAPNCGTVYDANIPEYNKTWIDSTGTSTIPVYDESCEAVCFGKAFRNDCQSASLTTISEEGTVEKLEILGKNAGGNCSVKWSFEDVGVGDEDNLGAFEGTYLTCPLPVEDVDLKDYSCPLDSCLEENMPGQTTLGIFQSMGIILAFGVAEDFGCTGTALDVSYCDENWSCGSWGSCTGGTQTRTCTDLSNCGTSLYKPSTSQSCVEENPVCTGEDDCICSNGVCSYEKFNASHYDQVCGEGHECTGILGPVENGGPESYAIIDEYLYVVDVFHNVPYWGDMTRLVTFRNQSYLYSTCYDYHEKKGISCPVGYY